MLVKVLLEFEDCAGGKLFVAPPPKALPPPNIPEAPFSPPMGAVAPKLKPDCCCGSPPPKFAL